MGQTIHPTFSSYQHQKRADPLPVHRDSWFAYKQAIDLPSLSLAYRYKANAPSPCGCAQYPLQSLSPFHGLYLQRFCKGPKSHTADLFDNDLLPHNHDKKPLAYRFLFPG
ncbi:hypothetical protein D3C86_1815650 [compost metagenome]